MRRRVVFATLALMNLCWSGCGDAGESAKSTSARAASDAASATLPHLEVKVDAELDSDSYPGEPDNDRNHVFGHAADVANGRAATLLVKRYYAAAAEGNGARACSLDYAVFAESIPEAYGPLSGTPSTSARTCAVVMSNLFRHMHRQLRADNATLRVAAVRVLGNQASVLLSFGGEKPKFYLQLHRERSAWKIDGLLATEQPIYVE